MYKRQSNGLLLRADIHTLFDLGLIGIEPETKTVKIAESLIGTSLDGLQGKSLRPPQAAHQEPSTEALEARWKLFADTNVGT